MSATWRASSPCRTSAERLRVARPRTLCRRRLRTGERQAPDRYAVSVACTVPKAPDTSNRSGMRRASLLSHTTICTGARRVTRCTICGSSRNVDTGPPS